MNEVIRVENLSKHYFLRKNSEQISSFKELISAKFTSWFCNKKSASRVSQIEEFWALNNVNFSIEAGDKVAIIGKNGSGKSTLLKILSRIIRPTKGFAEVKGKLFALLEVGTGFHPELSGRENIFLSGSVLGMKREEIRSKFDEIVEFANIEKFLDTPVKWYSSGMYTRLGFSIAAHFNPDILLIDEIMAVGDAEFQKKCTEKINALGNSGKTILYVSHNIPSIASLCNKGLYLESGTVKLFGSLSNCLDSYIISGRANKRARSVWGSVDEEMGICLHSIDLKNSGKNRNERQCVEHEILICKQGDFLTVNIDFENFSSIKDLIFGIDVIDKSDMLLAHSSTAHNPEIESEIKKRGRHNLKLTVDTGMFHQGEYIVRIDSVIHCVKRLSFAPIDIPFIVQEVNSLVSGKDYLKRKGAFLSNNWEVLACS